MSDVLREIEKYSTTNDNDTVLILGERGTGKTTVAGKIHARSRRKGNSPVVFGCGTVPKDLLTAELFGCEKIATDVPARPGLLQQADGGTILVDDIQYASHGLQYALLGFLTDGRVRKLGGKTSPPVDVRLILACNLEPQELIRDGKMLPDFYDRIKAFTISLQPLRDWPLRERQELMIEECVRRQLPLPRFTPEAQRILDNCAWKGNFRDLDALLKNIESDILTGETISIEKLPTFVKTSTSQQVPPVEQLRENTLRCFHAGQNQNPISLTQFLDELRSACIREELILAGGNKSAVARRLRIDWKVVDRAASDTVPDTDFEI